MTLRGKLIQKIVDTAVERKQKKAITFTSLPLGVRNAIESLKNGKKFVKLNLP